MNRNRLRAGFSLTESLTAAVLTTMIVFTGLSIFLAGMGGWLRGNSRIDAETQSRLAVSAVSDELREAMNVTVAADGLSLTYRLPQRDANGSFVIPATWDGQTRRIFVNGNRLIVEGGGRRQTIGRNLILTDPLSVGGAVPYRVFTPGPGTITRRLHVMVVVRQNLSRGERVFGRKRETIHLRNIPELSR